MTTIHVAVDVDAPVEDVWADLADIGSHVEWMADAEAIHFTSTRRQGVGTSFDCLTKVGPVRLTDTMVCIEWIPNRVLGIRHEGLVTGTGRLELTPLGPDRTSLTWTESLRFPLVLGGRVGAAVGGRLVLRPLWTANLKRFAARFG